MGGHWQGRAPGQQCLRALSPPLGQARSWSRPPGTAVSPAPAACSACARWTSTPLVCPHPAWCWGGAPVSALGVLRAWRSPQLLFVCRQCHGFWGSDLTSTPDAAPCHTGRGGCRALLLCWNGWGPRLLQGVSLCLVLSCPPPRCGRHLGVAQCGCALGSSLRARSGAQASVLCREDPRAQVMEQLCYGCRVNMKDLVSGHLSPG